MKSNIKRWLLGLDIKMNSEDSNFLLVRLRWFAIAFYTLALFSGVTIKVIDLTQFSKSLIILIGLVFFNTLSEYSKGSVRLLNKKWFQILFDLTSVTAVLYLCGGLKNPLFLILILHALLIPLFLKLKEAVAIFIFSILSLVILYNSPYEFYYLASRFNWFDFVIYGMIITMLISWTVMSWLMGRMREHRKYSQNLKEQSLRVDRYRAMGALTAGFCHELGTPFNTMRMRLDRLMRNQAESPDVMALDQALESSIFKLQKMMDTLSNEENVELKKVNLTSTIKEIISPINEEDEIVSFKETEDVFVKALLIPLTNSLLDILDNSLEAGAKNINMAITKDHDYCNIIVQDDGSGFNEIILENFGEPFLTTKSNGTGLGLYNLKQLVELFGGLLKISNNSGARVEVKLELWK